MYLTQLDTSGYYVGHILHEEGAPAPAGLGWIRANPPENPAANNLWAGSDWLEIETRPEATPWPAEPIVYVPDQRSKIEFRRLLLPKEALWFDAALTEPPMTAEQLDEAFDANTTTPQLQLLAAKRDAMMQWGLLDDQIELNHDDTRDFLFVMAACGMFGANASTRVPQILAGQNV